MAANSFLLLLLLCQCFYLAASSEDFVIENQEAINVAAVNADSEFLWDPKGYVVFCLCMGRFGNQAAHFLGAMAYAKALDRTFVVPPFITYYRATSLRVPYEEWFDVDALREYHRVITMEDFMERLAPLHWPPGNRTAFCYRPYPEDRKDCAMKEGNPFGPFWDHYHVDFDQHVFHGLAFDVDHAPTVKKWKERFPPSEHPVLAFKGAPAHYPEEPRDRDLQRFMRWSQWMASTAEAVMAESVAGRPYLGIHLRIGSDWEAACKHAKGKKSYMESQHCLEGTDRVLDEEMCLPTTSQIARTVTSVLKAHKLSIVYIASDVSPPLKELRQKLSRKVEVFWMNPERPQVDLYILEKSDVFIGSCASSFTAFAKRARDLQNKSTLFWGLVE